MSDLSRFGTYCLQMSRIKGVQSAADRALWLMLANEVAAYMAGDPDVIQALEPTPDDVPLEGM